MQEYALPLLLAGPILRRVEPDRVIIWFSSSRPFKLRLAFEPDGEEPLLIDDKLLARSLKVIKLGESCYTYLLDLTLGRPLPADTWIAYDAQFLFEGSDSWQDLKTLVEDLLYPGRDKPGFVVASQVRDFLHGSCRKPHHEGEDGLVRADTLLASLQEKADLSAWPAMLVMHGDQIYADDVAGPMLVAIHALQKRLGFSGESFESSAGSGTEPYLSADELATEAKYYHREDILPKERAGKKQKIFSSVNSHNHLISLAEVTAMYLLVWSPACWGVLDESVPASIAPEDVDKYKRETVSIAQFVTGLGRVRRLLAHIPTAMIFDDHDVTDDWNLTAGWEQSAYQDVFAKRIIGNALVGYFVFQGWGNAPERFDTAFVEGIQASYSDSGSEQHNTTVDRLLKFPHWDFSWNTTPALVVLDTRTQRWRSEEGLNKPSGLMDWEALTELQQQLIGMESVILVSPAPIFGVKLIETIQEIFTFFGKPLVVDAENWMAHSGAALFLLNMFHHSKTPQRFVILSGDVHYSFTYRVRLRRKKGGPSIWQITSSGLKSEFPKMLLEIFDRVDRWMYAHWSPFNMFTKRRGMRVAPFKPVPASAGERLVNGAGVGYVKLDGNGAPIKIKQLCANGVDVDFT